MKVKILTRALVAIGAVLVGPILVLVAHYFISTGSYTFNVLDNISEAPKTNSSDRELYEIRVKKYGVPLTSRKIQSDASSTGSAVDFPQQIVILRNLIINTGIICLATYLSIELIKNKQKKK